MAQIRQPSSRVATTCPGPESQPPYVSEGWRRQLETQNSWNQNNCDILFNTIHLFGQTRLLLGISRDVLLRSNKLSETRSPVKKEIARPLYWERDSGFLRQFAGQMTLTYMGISPNDNSLEQVAVTHHLFEPRAKFCKR